MNERMEDSDEEDPIEELCEYLDLKVEQYCEDENIPVKEASVFQNICYEYKKKLRKGTIKPPMRPQSAFRDILELFHEHQVAEQLMNEDIDSYKSKDKEWTAHVKSVLTELNDIFHKATIKYPEMLNSRTTPYKAIFYERIHSQVQKSANHTHRWYRFMEDYTVQCGER